MSELTEFDDLIVALEATKPKAAPVFTDKLDQAVADHFPKEWSAESWGSSTTGFFDPIRGFLGTLRQNLLPVTAGFACLLLVGTTVATGIGRNGEGSSDSSSSSSVATDMSSSGGSMSQESAAPPAAVYGTDAEAGGASADAFQDSGSIERFKHASKPVPTSVGPNAAGVQNRKVAQDVEITLGTKPEDVQEVSNEIVDVVDSHDGIVLDSTVEDGPAGQAGATFSLMIPSTQLEDAVADLSGIADLKSRNQETEDITAPTLTVEDSLQTSKARIESLVTQLSEATTDEERADVEAELGQERRQAARLTTRLNQLERRANLTPVAVTVVTDETAASDESGGTWGIDDAVDDAGHMLGIAAGVALIALAIAIPIGIIVLVSLALNRAWVRRQRRRVLEEN